MKPIKFQLTIEHLWGLAALVGIFVFVNTHPIRPHDFWWHITIGREIISTGQIPTIDIYSYTANGQPYPSYQMFWLMEIVLYELFNLGGPALVIFIHSLVICSAYVIIFWICKQLSKSWRIAAFGAIFAAALGLNDWNVRPQGITFLLASLFLLAIYEYRKYRKWGWLAVFPLGMLVWVNSHGTFLIGLVLMGIWLGQTTWDGIQLRNFDENRTTKRLVLTASIIFGITTLTCLINPRGLGIINYIKTLTGNSVVQNLVTEWAPPTFNNLMGTIFLLGLMGGAIVLALSPQRPNIIQIMTFLVFGLLGLKTSRGSVWFGLAMAPILAEHISSIVNQLQTVERRPMNLEGSRTLNIIFAIVIIAMGLLSLPWFKSALPLPQAKAGLVSEETPVQATQVLLKENPTGRVFNSMSFGSYLIWAAYPQYQVFVDPRIELFSEKTWLDYLNISNASVNWETLLNNYEVNILMLSPVEQPALVEAVLESGGWELLYKDTSAFLFRHK
ncbi:MAG: hypothetical protein A2Y53_05250 [Chloroflexi bacterium RBG_16_47_49]|nr:MAG: hypothetical protein A2Y53_05250 [Chloroflexi bacterium RBG_16_47_49]